MGRAWRIEYEGALYHLMCRGNDRQEIFPLGNSIDLFLELDFLRSKVYDTMNRRERSIKVKRRHHSFF